eukprot:TRINITY_DN4992_c0_g1_i1.p1 TRINITY_DN4992_c0_g1~~TRINITY_DN4992_c0_g1_i1.p1  ORF type:complete len:1354 (-),score=284.08 TRINITY_DN4992_c0_g1_i1:83-4144(-)
MSTPTKQTSVLSPRLMRTGSFLNKGGRSDGSPSQSRKGGVTIMTRSDASATTPIPILSASASSTSRGNNSQDSHIELATNSAPSRVEHTENSPVDVYPTSTDTQPQKPVVSILNDPYRMTNVKDFHFRVKSIVAACDALEILTKKIMGEEPECDVGLLSVVSEMKQQLRMVHNRLGENLSLVAKEESRLQQTFQSTGQPTDGDTLRQWKLHHLVEELGQFVDNFVDGLHFLVGPEGSVLEKYRAVAMRKQVDKTAELNQVFGGLDTIYSTFSSFNTELQASLAKWQETEELGAIIAKWAPHLLVMKNFIAANFANAKILGSWDSDPKSAFYGVVFKSKKDKTLQLKPTSFYITPCQFCPRLKMLLSDILKYLPENHTDRPNLLQALDITVKNAAIINEYIRTKENERDYALLTNSPVCKSVTLDHNGDARSLCATVAVSKIWDISKSTDIVKGTQHKSSQMPNLLYLFRDVLFSTALYKEKEKEKSKDRTKKAGPSTAFLPLPLLWIVTKREHVQAKIPPSVTLAPSELMSSILVTSPTTQWFVVLADGMSAIDVWVESVAKALNISSETTKLRSALAKGVRTSAIPFDWPTGQYQGAWIRDPARPWPCPAQHGKFKRADGVTFDGSWDIGLQAGFGRVIRVNKTSAVDIVKEGWKYELPGDGSGPQVTLAGSAQGYDCSWQATQLSTQDWELLFHRAFLFENLPKGFLLFEEGAKLGGIFKIQSGSVDINKEGTTINTLGEGEIFGVSSFYGGTTTTAAVIGTEGTSVYVAKLGDIDKILTCSSGLAYRFNYYAANCMFTTLQFVAKKTKPKQTNEASKFELNKTQEILETPEKKKKDDIEKRMAKKTDGNEETSYIMLKVKETVGKKISGFLLLFPSSLGFSPDDSSGHFSSKREPFTIPFDDIESISCTTEDIVIKIIPTSASAKQKRAKTGSITFTTDEMDRPHASNFIQLAEFLHNAYSEKLEKRLNLTPSGHVLMDPEGLGPLLQPTEEDGKGFANSDFEQTLLLLRRPAQITRLLVAPGGTIVQKGQMSRNLYTLVSGTITVKVDDIVVGTINPDPKEFFGESVLFGRPSSATLIASTDCVLDCLPINHIYTLFTRVYRFSATFYKFLGQKIFLCLKKREAELLSPEKKGDEIDGNQLLIGGDVEEIVDDEEEETYKNNIGIISAPVTISGLRGGARGITLNPSHYFSHVEHSDTDDTPSSTPSPSQSTPSSFSNSFAAGYRPVFGKEGRRDSERRPIFSQLSLSLSCGDALQKSASEETLSTDSPKIRPPSIPVGSAPAGAVPSPRPLQRMQSVPARSKAMVTDSSPAIKTSRSPSSSGRSKAVRAPIPNSWLGDKAADDPAADK